MYDSPRAMAKLLKEAQRVKQVLSANTDHQAQVNNSYYSTVYCMIVCNKCIITMAYATIVVVVY